MSDSRTEIAIAVVEQDNRFLVGRRPANVPLAGLWEFPGGKVEPGETPEQTAARECEEESGVAVEIIERYVVRDYDYAHAKVKLHFFSCRPIDPIEKPHGSFGWVERDELRNLQFPDANRPLIEHLTSHSFNAEPTATPSSEGGTEPSQRHE
jgi:8-oxo-dGTP diphosphatase